MQLDSTLSLSWDSRMALICQAHPSITIVIVRSFNWSYLDQPFTLQRIALFDILKSKHHRQVPRVQVRASNFLPDQHKFTLCRHMFQSPPKEAPTCSSNRACGSRAASQPKYLRNTHSTQSRSIACLPSLHHHLT